MCIRNKNHAETSTICLQCLGQVIKEPSEPDLTQVSPELRALFTQLSLQNRDFCKCWKSSFSELTIKNRKLKIENVYYAFYKADIGNAPLKKICRNPNCVNPGHLKSKYEPPGIEKLTRAGFSRKKTKITDLSDAEWLKQP